MPLLDLICPRACVVCGHAGREDGLHLCWDCRARLRLIQAPFCSLCGDPVDGVITHEYRCSTCVERPPSFDLARSAAHYSEPLSAMLQEFKYQGATHLTRDLALLLDACVRVHYGEPRFDAIVFVPLFHARERERTYNQSWLLAHALGRMRGLPVASRVLRRARWTPTQTRLTARQRVENVRGAFDVADPEWVAGRRFLVVDDVMTTGATVNECARVLKEARAALVCVATVARG